MLGICVMYDKSSYSVRRMSLEDASVTENCIELQTWSEMFFLYEGGTAVLAETGGEIIIKTGSLFRRNEFTLTSFGWLFESILEICHTFLFTASYPYLFF